MSATPARHSLRSGITAATAQQWRAIQVSRMRSIRLTAVIIAGTASALVTLASQSIPQDTGAAGAWQKIQKLHTTASVLHAHGAS